MNPLVLGLLLFCPPFVGFLLMWWRALYVSEIADDANWLLRSETSCRKHVEKERDEAQQLASMRAMEAEALQQKLTRTEQQFSQMQAAVNDLCDRWKPKPPGWTFPNEPIGTAEGR